jgi:hypothetical protein
MPLALLVAFFVILRVITCKMTFISYFYKTTFTMELNFKQIDKDKRPFVMIPLEDMVIRYLLREFGNDGNCIHGRADGVFGGVVSLMAEKRPYRQMPLNRHLRGHKLKLILPDTYRHATITEGAVMSVSSHFNMIFRMNFIAFVNGAFLNGSSVNAAVKKFLDVYGIGVDEWSDDTARRFYRYHAVKSKNNVDSMQNKSGVFVQ